MSASIINTSTNTKIFSTNNINKIEVSKENIIQSDSDFREVVKKGYLLSQINLSSIPDIIQDAINEAMLNAKEQTLADALIETLKLSIENLNDGIYKKTFINNTISYLEDLIVQKASPEIVASIAEAKIAVATANFATASQVQRVSSRVDNSESEIIKVKETINTNEVARALQIEQMESRVNDTFAGYSEAIDLYVDAQGNVKSQKIETLTTNIGLQLQEVNQLIVDTDNNWKAKSVKLITSPSGAITGYSFQDGSGLKSNFDIYADNFKISNQYNTYSPFSIVGTSLYFNGKVTFSNITGTDGVVTTSNVQTVFNSNVTTIDGGKIETNSINANKINTTGLIAENISANEIVGKTFTGSVINGAVINGAIVKASYLDLDGDLEVLTDYHITPTMYNANPSLYTDAVYMASTNEWRIPTLSIITEPIYTPKGTGETYSFPMPYGDPILLTAWNIGDIVSSKIKNYRCANSGNNLKIRKSNNIVINTTNASLGLLSLSYGRYGCTHYSQYSNGSTVELYFDDLLMLRCTYRDLRYSSSSAGLSMASFTLSGSISASGSVSTSSSSTHSYSYSFVFKGVPYDVQISTATLSVSISKGVYTIDNLTSSSGDLWKMKVIETFTTASPVNAIISFSSPAYMTINNMI